MRNLCLLGCVVMFSVLFMVVPAWAGYPEATSGFQLPMTNDHYGYEFLDYAYYSSCGYLYHPGSDLNGPGSGDADLGTLLRAMSNGIVIADGDSNNDGIPESYGSLVVACQYKTEIYYWRFFHCRRIYVQTGQTVTKGQVIAEMGKIGCSYSHVHVEVCTGDYSYGKINGSWPCSILTDKNLVVKYYRDPITFVASHGPYTSGSTGSYLKRWDFVRDRAGWSASSSFIDRGFYDNVWYLIPTGVDPYIASPKFTGVERNAYLVFCAMLRGSFFDIYVDTDKTSNFTGTLTKRYKTLNNGMWAIYSIPLSDIVPVGHKPDRIRIDAQGLTNLLNGYSYVYLSYESPLKTEFSSAPISWKANSHTRDHGVAYGNWKLEVLGNDPYITSTQFSGYETASTANEPYLMFRARLDGDFYEVFSQTNLQGAFTSTRRYRAPIVNSDGWAWYTVPLRKVVPAGEILTRLRIDYSNYLYSLNYFDSIYVLKHSPVFLRPGIDDWTTYTTRNEDLRYISTITNQYAAFQSIGPEPALEFRQFTAQATDFNKVRVYLRSSGGGRGTVYFQTATQPFYTGQKSQDYYIPADGQWHIFDLDFTGNSDWQGTITKLKVVLTDRTGLDIHVKEIGLLKN